MNRLFVLLFIFTMLASITTCAQKQLIFLKGDHVQLRFTEGDRFLFKLSNGKKVEGYIAELNDFSLVTSALDTISFLQIRKVSLRGQRHSSFLKKLGGLMLAGGLGYIAIDQANVLFGSNKSGFDQSNQIALGVAGAGALALLIKPKYRRVSRGTTIRTIDYKSHYYVPVN
ncbi:MAG: hypothetical protein ACK5RG_20395 [Cyclobacteriaceae bacterium]|jgi:hypothetical protein|nr:hypothetical protein [Flammeovirgaceae bacterium]